MPLCQIIPLNADDVLHKGMGTLSEALLMVQTYERSKSHGPDRRVQERREFLEGVCLYIFVKL